MLITVRLYAWLRGEQPELSDHRISETVHLARIVLIVGLVFLHYQEFPNSVYSPFDGLDPRRHQLATFLNSFILFFFFSAVPLLSTISGWLFFGFSEQDAAPAVRRRIRSRFMTLYLPMVVWNAGFLILLLLVFESAPTSAVLSAIRFDFVNASWSDYINSVFAVTGAPIGYQFWFIRDLFVTVLVSPFTGWLLRRAPYLTMIVLCGAFLSGSGLLIFFRTDVLFFFCIGGFLRMHRTPLQIGTRAMWTLLGLYVLLSALRALAPLMMEIDINQPRPELLTLATRLTRFLGVLACWGILHRLSATRLGAWLARFSGLSFFLYAAHFPLIVWVKATLWVLVPEPTDGWMIAHYIGSVSLTVAIAVTVALLLVKLAPNGFALMNGGRQALERSPPAPPVRSMEPVEGTPACSRRSAGEKRSKLAG